MQASSKAKTRCVREVELHIETNEPKVDKLERSMLLRSKYRHSMQKVFHASHSDNAFSVGVALWFDIPENVVEVNGSVI